MNFMNIFFTSFLLIVFVVEESSCAKLCVRSGHSGNLSEMFNSANIKFQTEKSRRTEWYFSTRFKYNYLNACHQVLQEEPELNVGYNSSQFSEVSQNGLHNAAIAGIEKKENQYLRCLFNGREIRLFLVLKMNTIFVSVDSPSSKNASTLVQCVHLNPQREEPFFIEGQLQTLKPLKYKRLTDEPVDENPIKHLLPEEDFKLCQLALATAKPDLTLTRSEVKTKIRLAFENPKKLDIYPNISYVDTVVTCQASDENTYYIAYAYKDFDAYLAIKLEGTYAGNQALYRALLRIFNLSVLDIRKDETNNYRF